MILALHSALVQHYPRYYLESCFPPLINPIGAEPYDGIVVLTGGMSPASGLKPFPSIDEATFHRLDEAWRLYRITPKPIIVSGGHVDPFSPDRDENKIACDFLRLWGIPSEQIIPEPNSRDTFENAVEVKKLLSRKGWRRYLLVTSASHMPRSMLVFGAVAPEPIAAPADFTLGSSRFSPLSLFPSEGAAGTMYVTIHEYVGLINYHLRLRRYPR